MTVEHGFTTEQEHEKDAVKQTVEKYLTALHENNHEAAMNLLSKEDQVRFEDSIDTLRDHPFGIVSSQVAKVSLAGQLIIDGYSRDYAHADVVLDTQLIGQMDHTYDLVKEGDWKIYFRSDITNGKPYTINKQPGKEIWESSPLS